MVLKDRIYDDTPMNLLAWALFGLIVGILAHSFDPSSSHGGVLGAILLGIGGALVGGFLANIIFGIKVSGFNLPSFLIAVAGSLTVLFLGRALRRI